MKQILTLSTDLLQILDKYSKFISENRPDKNLPNWRTKGKFKSEGRSEFATSLECIKSMPHDKHDGFPPDSFGYDMNEPTLLKTLQDDNYKQLGSQALEFSKNFSWKKIIKKYIELI